MIYVNLTYRMQIVDIFCRFRLHHIPDPKG